MGLFGKNKDDLIRWQNLVIDPPSPILHTTEKQLKGITPSIFQRHLDIANDSAKLFEKTANPKTFFDRYDSFIKECEFLLALSEFVHVRYMDIPKQLKRAKEQYNEIVLEFIQRYWSDTCKKAENLKTEKGKQNRYDQFYSTMKEYEYRMPEECINFYRSLTQK